MTDKILCPHPPLISCAGAVSPVFAGERQDIFPVTAQQMRAMSIQVKPATKRGTHGVKLHP